MLKRKPLFAALAAVGICASVNVHAGATNFVPTLTELCGTTVTEDTSAQCNTADNVLTSSCEIMVAADVHLEVNLCDIKGNGNHLYIGGAENASLYMYGSRNNSSISGATNIVLDFQGSSDPYCSPADVIDVDSYDMAASGFPGRQGNILFRVRGCGDLVVNNDSNNGSNMMASSSVRISANIGQIEMDDYYSGGPITAGAAVVIESRYGNVMINGFGIDAPNISIKGSPAGGGAMIY